MKFPRIDLHEPTHTYRVGGIVRPSVTQILGVLDEYAGVDRELLDRAARFGRNVHKAVDLFNRGTLDLVDLDPALAAYLAGWRKFLADTGAKVLHSEYRVWHPLLRYCGTADVALEWKGPVGCDLKSGIVPRSVGAQTMAYSKAQNEHGFKARRRICVQLRPNDYRMHRLNDAADWALFTSCMNVWGFKNVIRHKEEGAETAVGEGPGARPGNQAGAKDRARTGDRSAGRHQDRDAVHRGRRAA